MEKLLDRFIGDERKRKSAGNAALITLLLIWSYMIIRMLLVAMDIWNTNMVQNDLYFVMVSFIVFSVIAFRNETDDLIYSPISRKELPYKKGRFAGRFGIYLMESIAGAIFITIVELLVKSLIDRSFNFNLLMFISSILAFTIILIFFNIVSGEIRIRRFRKMEDE
ncbi:hypothetical protein FO441_01580 [Salinicoccus cyprini]|uniref:Uncharacterized protein n=1 Tax=Salinicoccus cyprini TaxID=2493691 RepID=A0A558AXK8_9STAP|nr:hypothetical protein [Salinicoccus cyprini]TVT28994.1 hypothetical protein FO441_01580 [Salinicoccus cyprini]